jgi:hypothetical protein
MNRGEKGSGKRSRIVPGSGTRKRVRRFSSRVPAENRVITAADTHSEPMYAHQIDGLPGMSLIGPRHMPEISDCIGSNAEMYILGILEDGCTDMYSTDDRNGVEPELHAVVRRIRFPLYSLQTPPVETLQEVQALKILNVPLKELLLHTITVHAEMYTTTTHTHTVYERKNTRE